MCYEKKSMFRTFCNEMAESVCTMNMCVIIILLLSLFFSCHAEMKKGKIRKRERERDSVRCVHVGRIF